MERVNDKVMVRRAANTTIHDMKKNFKHMTVMTKVPVRFCINLTGTFVLYNKYRNYESSFKY